MKYYSETLKKLFESEEDLNNAEKEFETKKEEEKKALSVKKDEAKEVEEAYKKYIQAKKDAYKLIDDAEKEYIEKRNAFVKKYGSFHMTYKDTDVEPFNLSDWFTDLNTIIDNFLR